MASARASRRVLASPRFLFVKNDAVHVAAANSHHRRAAGLTFERYKSERFLDAGMNEKIRRAIIAGQIK